MKMTVKDCLELDVFKPCVVASGNRNLKNSVRSVSVLDAIDSKTAVKNNGVKDQLILTSFYGMAGDTKTQIKVVKALADKGVGGLVLFHSPEGVTPENALVVEAAEACGLPLIILTSGNKAEYSDVIEGVMDKLLAGSDLANDLINNTISNLMDFDRHGSFPEALRVAALKNDFQVVLISKNFNPILIAENRHKVSVADAIRKLQKKGRSDDGRRYSILDVDDIAAFWGTVNIGDEEYFLLIVDNEERYSAVEITKLAEIIQLAMGMWKYTPVRDAKAELIKALIRGNRSLAYSLKNEVGLENFVPLSAFYGKSIDGTNFTETIETYEKANGCDVISITEGDETYGIILKRDDCSTEDNSCKTKCISLFNSFKETSGDVRIFHVTGFGTLEDVADGFTLINETSTFVESVFPHKRVFSKYEMVLVSNCISIQLQGGHIKRNYVSLLEPFMKEMGENKARQLLDTLETFVLDAGMNSSKTAKFMDIHTNTVQYRLKRINEVLGAEITGNRVIPGLTIALALQRLERVVNE
ncbi:MAG: PucR family transcriptional regulator [Firmicutes bacterium]|nr:PucR family transcriptional regulator [Bacillota bacterium]